MATLAEPPARLGVTHWSSRLLGVGNATVAKIWWQWGPAGTPGGATPVEVVVTLQAEGLVALGDHNTVQIARFIAARLALLGHLPGGEAYSGAVLAW